MAPFSPAIGALTNLEALGLYCNPLSGVFPYSISTLKDLSYLSLPPTGPFVNIEKVQTYLATLKPEPASINPTTTVTFTPIPAADAKDKIISVKSEIIATQDVEIRAKDEIFDAKDEMIAALRVENTQLKLANAQTEIDRLKARIA